MKRHIRNQRFRLAMLTLIGFVGCTDTTAPPKAIIGTFGGVGAELVASRKNVLINLDCDHLYAETPLVPDESGGFVLAAEPFSRRGNVIVTVRGIVDEAQITFDVIWIDAYQTYTGQYSVMRDRPREFSGAICAALIGSVA